MPYVNYPYQVTGLIPAAGEGSRLGVLPCSKEIYPIGIQHDSRDKTSNVKVAMHYVMEKMKHAGITRIFVVVNKNKWDIPKYFKDGSMVGVNVSYLVMDSSPGVPFTLDQAHPFIGQTDVALGFPDILFKSDDAYSRLLEKKRITNADIVLGCFPVENKGKFDMVLLDKTGRIRSIVIKPDKTELQYCWAIAVWSPKFTVFMHEYLAGLKSNHQKKVDSKEIYVGNIFKAALDKHFIVESVLFSGIYCTDIGTSQDLFKSILEFNKKE